MEELLVDVMHAVRLVQVIRSDDPLLDESELTSPAHPAPSRPQPPPPPP